MDSTKFGLNNIRSRFAFFTEKKVIVDESPEWFTVKIPLIKN